MMDKVTEDESTVPVGAFKLLKDLPKFDFKPPNAAPAKTDENTEN